MKTHKVHVWLFGDYIGAYEFATADEADADFEYRQRFRPLGFRYTREDRP